MHDIWKGECCQLSPPPPDEKRWLRQWLKASGCPRRYHLPGSSVRKRRSKKHGSRNTTTRLAKYLENNFKSQLSWIRHRYPISFSRVVVYLLGFGLGHSHKNHVFAFEASFVVNCVENLVKRDCNMCPAHSICFMKASFGRSQRAEHGSTNLQRLSLGYTRPGVPPAFVVFGANDTSVYLGHEILSKAGDRSFAKDFESKKGARKPCLLTLPFDAFR